MPDTLIVVWRVTEQCDLGCHFCKYSRELPYARMSAAPEQVLAFGALLRDYGDDVLVCWLGGEPLLWKPLPDLAHVLKNEFHLRLSVTTNGTRLNLAAVRRHLLETYDRVTISLDGLGALHDAVRDAAGLYAQLSRNIFRLCADKARLGRGPVVHLNTILMKSNVRAFEALCRTAAEWGVEELTFNELGGVDRGGAFYERERLGPEDVAWLKAELPGLRARLAERGLMLWGGARYLARLENSAQRRPLPVSDCRPGQTFLFIDERGRVSPCCFAVREYGVPLDEIKTAADVRRLPDVFSERKRQNPAAYCADCRSTQVFEKYGE